MVARFLEPQEVARELENLFRDASRAKLAVAFWGLSSIKRLGLDRNGMEKRVVLNLMSGAVDPAVIGELGLDNVRSDNRLHAKIYWTDRGVIVGSANASSNGLAMADDELRGWKEAAVWLAPGTEAWKKAEQCVDVLFNESCNINADMLREAKRLWAERRKRRPYPLSESSQLSLAEAIQKEPYRLRDRHLWLLIEEPAEQDPLTANETAIAQNLGIDLADVDLWDGHVPLGMTAIVFDRTVNRRGTSEYEVGYVSKTRNKRKAYTEQGGGNKITEVDPGNWTGS